MNNLENIIKYNDECVMKFASLISLEMKNGIQSIYNDTKKNNKIRKKILKEFQQNLSNIPKWSQKVVDNEYNRIKILSKSDFFDDLIQNIFKSYFKVLFLIKKKRENLNIPESNNVIHNCYISLAREIWKKPILFYHKLEKKEIQKNHIEINNLIIHSIKIAIKDLLPFKEILNNYLENEEFDSDDDFDDFDDFDKYNLNKQDTDDFIEEQILVKEDVEGNVEDVEDVEGNVEDVEEDVEGNVEDVEEDVEDNVEDVEEDAEEDVEGDVEGNVEDVEGNVENVEDVEGNVKKIININKNNETINIELINKNNDDDNDIEIVNEEKEKKSKEKKSKEKKSKEKKSKEKKSKENIKIRKSCKKIEKILGIKITEEEFVKMKENKKKNN